MHGFNLKMRTQKLLNHQNKFDKECARESENDAQWKPDLSASAKWKPQLSKECVACCASTLETKEKFIRDAFQEQILRQLRDHCF